MPAVLQSDGFIKYLEYRLIPLIISRTIGNDLSLPLQ